jgi:hypothetical protein
MRLRGPVKVVDRIVVQQPLATETEPHEDVLCTVVFFHDLDDQLA